MKRTRNRDQLCPPWLKPVVKWLGGFAASVLLFIGGYEYSQYRERNSFTVQEVQQLSPLRVGIGNFWFDAESRAFASLTSSLRTDGVEVIELSGTPDRKIAGGLHYKSPEDLFLFESVPLPNHRSCFPEPLEAIQERELVTWQELVRIQEVDVLVLGEVTSDPQILRLWIGSMDGPQSLVLSFSTRSEITEATYLAKVAILMAIPQIMERRLNLATSPEKHVQKVMEAVRSLTHTLAWKGIDQSSQLAMEVTRARLQVNLLIHGREVATHEIEDSYWALRQSNRIAAPCGSVSTIYHQDEAILAVVLTRRTESDAWDRRALAAFERVKAKAEAGGSCGAAGMSERMISRLIVERGLRQNNPDLIEEGLANLERQYARLTLCSSPTLAIMLPDTMIVLYRQAAKETLNEEYGQRAKELWERHNREFPKGGPVELAL